MRGDDSPVAPAHLTLSMTRVYQFNVNRCVMQHSPADAWFELQFSNGFLEFFPGYFCQADIHFFSSSDTRQVEPSPSQDL